MPTKTRRLPWGYGRTNVETPKTPTSEKNKCRLILKLNGKDYTVRPMLTAFGEVRKIRLTADDEGAFCVVENIEAVECDSCMFDSCVHIAALKACGLIGRPR